MTPREKAQELFNKYATYVTMWTGGVEVKKQSSRWDNSNSEKLWGSIKPISDIWLFGVLARSKTRNR